MKNDRFKNVLIIILIFGILSLTVAYAALSTTLKIKSASKVDGGTWNVLFVPGEGANVPYTEPSTGRLPYINGEPTLTATSIDSINAVLTQPGDVVSYNFKIRNSGSIDAKLSTITNVIPTCRAVDSSSATAASDEEKVCANVSRTLKYAGSATKIGGGAGTSPLTNGNAVSLNDVLNAGEEIPVTLTISYASSSNSDNFPASDIAVTYNDQSLVYIQN